MGKVVVGLIAFAILSFVLTDLLTQNSIFFGDNDSSVGEIAGEKIDVTEYQEIVDRLTDNYRNNFGRGPGLTELTSLRNQAWQLLVVDKAYEKQYDDLGITVSPDELVDMVQGKNISPDIQQIFTNPQTGQFDRDRLIQTLSQMNQTPQGRAQWNTFEQSLIPARKRIKFDNLMTKTNSVSEGEGNRDYQDQTAVAEIKYIYVPNFAVTDSLVEVNNSELNTYLDDHSDEYQVDWSKSIKYVSFSIAASPEDSAYMRDELRGMIDEFRAEENDSIYARANSDADNYYTTYNLSDLPDLMRSNLVILKPGDVIGPYLDNNTYALYKIASITEDTVGYARASHILIKWDDESDEAKAQALTIANDVLAQLLAGADFAELAKDNSTDGGSAINGGDLGWFDNNTMVEEFNDAVFNANSAGLIPKLIETQFGYHIITITELPTYTKYKIASIARIIDASDATRDKAFREADLFAGTSGNESEFLANAKKDNYTVFEADDLKQNEVNIIRVGYARQVITWLFNLGEVGMVSDVYELDDRYLVALVTKEIEKGTASLETVKPEIIFKVKEEKKGDIIMSKLTTMSGSLEEIVAAYGDDANVYNSSDLLMSSFTLPSVGKAPEAIGTIFALNNGERTEPIRTENGVVVIDVISVTPAPEIADISIYITSIQQSRSNSDPFYLSELVKEKADIVDKRYKFY